MVGHNNQLAEELRIKIRQDGSLDFAEFMHDCLYHVQFGYYRQGRPIIGREGDFITSSTLGPLLAETMHNYLKDFAQRYSLRSLIEFGGGNGDFIANFIARDLAMGKFFNEYNILEVAKARCLEQHDNITQVNGGHDVNLSFLAGLDTNKSFSGVGFANELLDAFPVSYFKVAGDDVLVGKVISSSDCEFGWLWELADVELVAAVRELKTTFPDGYIGVISLGVRPWLAAAYDFWERGVLVLVDYGGTEQECFGQRSHTVRGFCRHKLTDDPLASVGNQDLTADVDFSMVARLAREVGWQVVDYQPQNKFLIDNGVLGLYSEKINAGRVLDSVSSANELKQLVMPGLMGERFKVLVLAKGIEIDIASNLVV